MTCPHCGAYSPKNTATCNRCGRRLPLLEAQREQQRILQEKGEAPTPTRPEHEGYGYGYRQPEPTKLGMFLEEVGTFLDTHILEDPTTRNRLLAALGSIIVLIILLISFSDCSACSCRGDDVQPPVSIADVSSSDVSGSDVSPSDISASDIAAASV